MATIEDIDQAQERIEAAVSKVLGEYLSLIKRTVFADPARPDWLVWPTLAWQELVADRITPVVVAEFRRVFGEEVDAADARVAREISRAAAETFRTEFGQVSTFEAVPDRVLVQVQAEVAADPSGAGIAALLVASAAVWARVVTVFGLNAGSFAVNAAVFAAAAAVAGTFVAGSAAAGGVSVMKRWKAIDDPRTRPTHAAVDGVEVGLGEPFTVGGFPLRYPHDPFGPPQEVFNCRCVLSFRSR